MNIKKNVLLTTLLACSITSYAYDPRSYSLIPTDVSLVEIQHSVVETQKNINSTTKINLESTVEHVRLLRSLDFFGNLAGAYVILPYQNNDGKINLGSNTLVHENQSSLGDIKLFFGIGVYNMPALTKQQFSGYDRNGIKASCSGAITLPTGDYKSDKLFSVGSNQKSLKGECSANYTKDKFVAEYSQGLTSYGNNSEYLKASTLEKGNLYHQEIHLSYNLAGQTWGGVSLLHQSGGGSYINQKFSNDSQDNTSIGLVLNYYLDRTDIIKVNYQKTLSSPDFSQKQNYWAIAYQKVF